MSRTERPDKIVLPPDTFGGFVYYCRTQAGIQLLEAGRNAGFADGCYLALIENGRRVPLLRHVPRLAQAIKANPAELSWLWIKEHALPVWNVLHGLDPGPDGPTVGKVLR